MPGGLRTLPRPGQELLQGALTGEWKRNNCISMVLRGPAAGSQQLERVLSLWLSTCRLQRGERNVDSLTVVGSGDRYELSGGQFGNVHESPRDVCTLRSCNSVSENFSEGNRHIGGATSFFWLFCFCYFSAGNRHTGETARVFVFVLVFSSAEKCSSLQ